MNEYEVRVTRLALEQMKEIVHYISNDLMAPDAADNLLDKMKAEITKLPSFPKNMPCLMKSHVGLREYARLLLKIS